MSEKTISRKTYVRIIKQPCEVARFGNDSEGKSAEILEVKNTDDTMSYPTIEIVNHRGRACVAISCVTKDEPYMPHPNNIIGTGPGIAQGICYLRIPAGHSVISFPNTAIQMVDKKDIIKSLRERENLMVVDPFKNGYDVSLDEIDLSCVRLCFEVFLEGAVPGEYDIPLDPVVSTPISDRNIVEGNRPKICWISHYSAPVGGGTVVCLLCEKVTTDGIQVHFFNQHTQWEAIAEFTSPKYHREMAVICKTPKYISQEIEEPVKVSVQLKLSDGKVSTPIPFEFIPEECASEDGFKAKRQKRHESPRDLVFRHLHEKADENANLTVSTNAFPIVNTNPWGLPETTMHDPNIVKELKNFSIYKEIDEYRKNPSTNYTIDTGFNHAYYNAQPMTENSTMNNDFAQQIINFKNNNPNYDEQYPENENEQTNQEYSHPDLDKLLVSLLE